MLRSTTLLTAATLLGVAGAAQAGGLPITGVVDLSFGKANHSTVLLDGLNDVPVDTGVVDLAAVGVMQAGIWTMGIDLAFQRDLENVEDGNGTDDPEQMSHVGLHVGRDLGGTYVGAFFSRASVSLTEGNPGNDISEQGRLIGFEGATSAGGLMLFGQVGQFEGTGNDNEALDNARFATAGASSDVWGGTITGRAAIGVGDNPDEEEIRFNDVSISYGRSVGNFPGTMSVELQRLFVDAPIPEETVTRTTLFLGWSIPLGGGDPGPLHYLTTPTSVIATAGYTDDIVD